MNLKIGLSFVGFFLFFSIILIPTVSGLTESSSSYGKLIIDKDVIIFSKNEQVILQISGNVTYTLAGEKVNLFITEPDSSRSLIILIPDNDGNFYTEYANTAWSLGNYGIQAVYRDQEVGSVTFVVTKVYSTTTETQQESINTESESLTEKKSKQSTYITIDGMIETISDEELIPSWVKDNAKSWSDDSIGDKDFASEIEFLLNEGIIKIQQTTEKEKSNFTVGEIPNWIKSNAQWWSEDLISDQDFLNGIEFLIKEEVIEV